MDTTLLISITIFIALLFIAQLVMFVHMYNTYRKNIQLMSLSVEAIGKLTQAQKSCLSYLHKIQKEFESNDGK